MTNGDSVASALLVSGLAYIGLDLLNVPPTWQAGCLLIFIGLCFATFLNVHDED